MVKKLLSNFTLLLTMMVAGAGAAWGAEVTYTISSRNTLTTSGTAPEGSSATIVETYSTSCQMTKSNSQTLKLKGYDGCTITKIVMSMHSNSSGGSGCFGYSVDAGSNYTWVVGKYATTGSTGVQFSNAAWHGSWSSSYVDVTQNVNIECGSDDVWFFLYATANSLYCRSYTITYEQETSSLTKIGTIGNDFATTSLEFDATGTFARPTITFAEGTTEGEDYEVEWTSSDSDKLTVETDGSYLAGTTEGSVDVTITVEPYDDTVYEAVSKTFTVNIVDPNRKGTELNPYTVAEVIDGTATGNNVYVKGFIVGSFNNGSVTSTYAESNLALADTYDESGSNAIPVQLVNGTAPRTNFNPQNNPWNVNVAQVLVKANVETYFSVNGLKSTSEIQKVAEQVSITSAGMATYYTDCALDLTEFTDMYAYTATVSGNTITFSRVQQVPAETGVLLRNPAGAAASNVVPVATGTVAAVDGNKFVGTLTDITVDGDDCYILNNSATNGLGFYKVKSSGSKVGAHRAYLKTGTEGVRSFIGFSEGDANGIESVGAEAGQSMEVYNLQGVRVAQPTKGLYIMNGKKVIFK